MRAYERLLKYIKVNTQSDEKSYTTPTTECQFKLADMLVDEMNQIGISDVRRDDKCYVYGNIPASKGYENMPAIGFIAHMDTSPDFSGEGVNPQIINNYDGGDVVLGDSGRILKVSDFPHLKSLVGRTLITTDGTTLLGSDDKSGIAEIMTAAEMIIESGKPHGKVCIAFTPDEEVGAGADHFDVEGFGADFAYTVDGGEEGEIVYENFNADSAVVEINGFNVHPGSAKDIMINSQLVAMEFNSMLPKGQTPRDTEGYEGFYHLCNMEGDVEYTRLEYIIRDHDICKQQERKNIMEKIADKLNDKYGENTVMLDIEEQYRNMREKIEPCMYIVDDAKKAIESCGISPVTFPERGGTDGAMLSFKGLPCPNLGTGGYGFHGPYEHVTVEGMDKAVQIICRIAVTVR